MNDGVSEEGQNAKIAVEYRLAVLKAGKFVWILIIALSGWGIYSKQYHLIAVAIIAGWAAMWLLSYQAANKVEKLTGLSHKAQAAIWEQYKMHMSEQ